jgi:cell division protease FtsH
MKVSKEDKEEFFIRRDVLDVAKIELKKEFVGLNDIIDEMIDLIEPWYLFPFGQIRPTIINLFGMTGVGKTSLIKRLFELINLKDNLYKFDVGDYATQDNTKLSYSFSEKLRNREKQQIGLIFDEFQLGRTIDEQGLELEKSGLRAMWDLLDSGKISILQSSYCGSKVYQLTLKLEDCVNNGSVEVKDGKVSKNKSYHEKFFKKEDDEDMEIELPSKKKKKKNKKNDRVDGNSSDGSLFIPEDFYWYIQDIWENRFLICNKWNSSLVNHM